MKETLLAYLVCPQCKTPLKCEILREDGSLCWKEIIEGVLRCQDCHREFPITAGVPRLFISEQQSDEVKNTVDGFGWEWERFNDSIRDTYMTDRAHFLDFIYPITKEFFEDKLVLDAGCGLGRFLKLGAEWGSRQIIGVDLSKAADVAYQNTRTLPNAHVVQADIMALPFATEFDYIFSVGVLHHLGNPKEGFSKLAQLLKHGGQISVWVYSAENNRLITSVLTPVRERVTSHLPRRILFAFSYLLGAVLFAGVRLIYKPANEVALGRRLKRFLPYNDYLYYSSRLSYASLVSVVFDHLVPQLAHYTSREELLGWFQQEELTAVKILTRRNMSWRAHGSRV